MLETAEEKAAKETRTRQLLAAYRSEMGLDIDPKLKSECEEVCFYQNIIFITCFYELVHMFFNKCYKCICIKQFKFGLRLYHVFVMI